MTFHSNAEELSILYVTAQYDSSETFDKAQLGLTNCHLGIYPPIACHTLVSRGATRGVERCSKQIHALSGIKRCSNWMHALSGAN